MKTVFKGLGIGLSVILIICLLLSAFALSPWGTRSALNIAQYALDELSIKYKQGGLLSTIELDSLQWQQAPLSAEFTGIKLAFDWNCLFSLRLCIETFEVAGSNIKLPSGSDNEAEPTTSTAMIISPIPVFLNNLALNKIDISQGEQLRIKIDSIRSKLHMFSTLTVDFLSIKDLLVNLPDAQAEQASAQEPLSITDISSWQYQPIKLEPISFPIALSAKKIAVEGIIVTQDQQTLLALENVQTELSMTRKRVNLKQLQIKHSQGQLKLSGEVGKDLSHDLIAVGELYEVNGTGKKQSLDLRIKGNQKRFGLTLKAQGLFALDANISADLSDANLPITGQVTWKNLGWPLDQPEFTSASGTWSIDGDLKRYTSDIRTELAGVSIPGTKLQLKVAGNQHGLNISNSRIDVLEGSIALKGELTLQENATWQGNINATNIKPQSFWPNLVADISGEVQHQFTFDGQDWALEVHKLAAQGTWMDYPLAANGQLRYANKVGLDIDQVRLSSGENELIIEGKMDQDQAISGNLSLVARKLAQLYPGLNGETNIQASLGGTLEKPTAKFSATGDNVLWQELDLRRFTSEGELAWDTNPTFNLETELLGLRAGVQAVNRAQLQVKGSFEEHNIDLSAQLPELALDTQLSGKFNPDKTLWSGHLKTASIDLKELGFVLEKSSEISIDLAQQDFSLSAHCWQQKTNTSSSLCIQTAKYHAGDGQLALKGEKLPWLVIGRQFVRELEPLKTSSGLDILLNASLKNGSLPIVDAELSLSPASWQYGKEQESIKLEQFKATVKSQYLDANKPLSWLSEIELRGTPLGHIHSNIALTELGEQGQLSGTIKLDELSLDSFQGLVPELSDMQGQLSAQLRLAGTMQAPLIYGPLSLHDGHFAGAILPANINDVQQTVTFNGAAAELKGAFKLGEGIGQVTGSIDWKDQVQGSLNISGSDMELDYQNMIRAKISPNITLNLQPELISMKGELVIPYARIKVRELPPSAVSVSSDVVIINQEPAPVSNQRPLEFNLNLIIDPKGSNEVKLDAFGLTTDLSGKLLLAQREGKTTANGDLSLNDGRYRAYGQDLRIRQGDIIFSGPLDSPRLTIEAIRDPLKTADDVVAGIRVDGNAQQPTVSIFSEPAMEQQQALSYLLRGQSINSSTETSGDALLADALLGLGLSRSENNISNIGRKLGVDDLGVEASGQGESTKLAISGYIAPGVQIRYGVGVFDSASEVAVRYQLLPKLYIEAVSGLNNAVDLYYQFTSKEQEKPLPKEVD